ncbi:MAG: HD domain-containing protein [Synergistaceae bacterium]|nr:HD domain-containing protein [Synergistaceae bacterium]
MINREQAIQAFKDYTAKYDTSNINVALKIAHTYRVAALSERIAKNVFSNDPEAIDISWLLGLLHDIGRFEQITRYGTFIDADSVDHAELGADILFKDNLFTSFVPGAPQKLRDTAETAIRLHNKLKLPDDLEHDVFAKILRDADKVDIFRVLTEPPYEEKYADEKLIGLPVRDKVMKCVMEHRCVSRAEGHSDANDLEKLISQCCMAFELEFAESRKVVKEQGYLEKLLNKKCKELSVVKQEIGRIL